MWPSPSVTTRDKELKIGGEIKRDLTVRVGKCRSLMLDVGGWYKCSMTWKVKLRLHPALNHVLRGEGRYTAGAHAHTSTALTYSISSFEAEKNNDIFILNH